MSGAGELLFVYGTLRRGASNAARMEGAEFVRAGRVRGRMYVVDWYPGLVLGEGDTVVGEVWRVPSVMLRELDEFEGISAGEVEGGEYRRVRVRVGPLDPGESSVDELETWVWEWKGGCDEERRIRSGDWFEVVSPGR